MLFFVTSLFLIRGGVLPKVSNMTTKESVVKDEGFYSVESFFLFGNPIFDSC